MREQVRVIYKELGDQDESAHELVEYQKKIKKAKMSKEASKEAAKQVKRLEQMHPDSAESTVIRTYLDWLVDMPWSQAYSWATQYSCTRRIYLPSWANGRILQLGVNIRSGPPLLPG